MDVVVGRLCGVLDGLLYGRCWTTNNSTKLKKPQRQNTTFIGVLGVVGSEHP